MIGKKEQWIVIGIGAVLVFLAVQALLGQEGETRCWPSKADAAVQICASVADLQAEFEGHEVGQRPPLLIARDSLLQAQAMWAKCNTQLSSYMDKDNADAIQKAQAVITKQSEDFCATQKKIWNGDQHQCVTAGPTPAGQ